MLVFKERGNAGTNTNVFNPASNLPIPGTDVQSGSLMCGELTFGSEPRRSFTSPMHVIKIK